MPTKAILEKALSSENKWNDGAAKHELEKEKGAGNRRGVLHQLSFGGCPSRAWRPFERYTENARRTIFFARYEASQFGSAEITAEHVLLGLLRTDRSSKSTGFLLWIRPLTASNEGLLQ